jgi:S1-C subfamily serine protease
MSARHALLTAITACLALSSCVQPVYVPRVLPPAALTLHLQNRVVLLSGVRSEAAEAFLNNPRARSFIGNSISSATPIAPDGYLMTAQHALTRSTDQTLLAIHRQQGRLAKAPATVIWQDANWDLALIHVPFPTPNYYDWTPRTAALVAGTPVVHGGIMTGPEGQIGQLTNTLPGFRSIARHTLPLRPGDSGGPLVTLDGKLVAIHHAIRFEGEITKDGVMLAPEFRGAESIRPDPALIARLIKQHRKMLANGNAPSSMPFY